MKTHILNYSMLLFMALLFFSCEKNSHDKNINTNLVSSEKQIEDFDTSSIFNPLQLEGSFNGWFSEDSEFILYTVSEENKHIFLIEGVDSNLKRLDHITGITYLDHILMVRTTNTTYYFAVDKPEEKAILNKLPLATKENIAKKHYGWMLSHQVLEKSDPLFNNIALNNLIKAENVSDYIAGLGNST